VGGDQVLRDALGQLEHVALQIAARQEVAPARVDHLALLVEHVVVLEEVLANVEVVRLDLLLRVADGARDEAVLDRYALSIPSAASGSASGRRRRCAGGLLERR